MLNEFIEYEEYTKDIFGKKKIDAPRLTPSLFINVSKGDNLLGIERAFEIVARHELFETYQYDRLSNIEEKTEAVERTKEALNTWFCDDWLKEYYKDYIWGNEKFKEKLKKNPEKWKWENFEEKKQWQFQNKLFRIDSMEAEKGQANTFRVLTYEKIVSNAIRKGPLQKYVLVAKHDWYFNVSKDGKQIAEGTKKDPEKSKVLRKDLDHILKGISAYLLAKEYDKKCTKVDNAFQVVNKTDIANWDQTTSIANNDLLKQYTYRKRDKDIPIFIKDDSLKEFSKICVDEGFLKEHGFKIVLKENIKQEKERDKVLTYYEDLGSMYFLKKEGTEAKKHD